MEKTCLNCGNCKLKNKDYKYNMHVVGGFMGCEIKRKAIKYTEPCEDFIKRKGSHYLSE